MRLENNVLEEVDINETGIFNIPEGVETIGDYAFYECSSLVEINIPEGVKTIGACAFDRCTSLEKINIPEEVETIGDYAFSECTSLVEINIPNSVKTIGEWAFYGCTSLEKINYKNQILSVKNIDGDCMVIKSSKSLNDYQTYKATSFDDYEHINRVKSQGYVTPNDYRLITGASRQGTERFLAANNLTWDDKMDISRVCELVQNQYGGSKFIEAMR